MRLYLKTFTRLHEPKRPGWGHKLLKSIYGYRKAPRNWYNMLADFIVSLGFTRCVLENCLFFKWIEDKIVVLLLYVDDLLIGASDLSIINDIKLSISKRFKITDLGPLKRFLNIKVDYDIGSHITLSQLC